MHYSQWRNTFSNFSFDDRRRFVIAPNPLNSMKYEPAMGSGFLLNYNNTLTPQPGDDGRHRLDRRNQQPVQPDQVQLPRRSGRHDPANITFDGQHAPTNWGTRRRVVQSINRKLGIAIVNNWLWTKGRHTFNIGWEFRRSYQDDNEEQTAGGRFQLQPGTRPPIPSPTSSTTAAPLPATCWAFRTPRTAATRRNCGCATVTSRPISRTTSSSRRS